MRVRAHGTAIGRATGLAGAIALVTLAAVAPRVSAQTTETPAPAPITSREAYDHRPPEDRTLEEALRWIPRVVLAPLRLAIGIGRESTRAVLEPIGPPPSSADADEPRPPPVLALPTVQLETEVSPAIGVHVRALPAPGLRLDASIAHWDDERIEGWIGARAEVGSGSTFELVGEAGTRGDRIFHGLGWDTAESERTRYRHHRGGARLAWRLAEPRLGALTLGGRVAHHGLEGSEHRGEPSLATQDEGWRLRDATVLEPRIELAIDTRAPDRGASRDRSDAGTAIAVGAGVASDVASAARWARLEARAAGTIVIAPEHELLLEAWSTAIEPASAAPIPLVELAILGGEPGRLAGVPLGRLTGESAAILHARYRWGIDTGADAALHVELGNAFGRGWHGLEPGRARLSVGLAIDGLGDPHQRWGLLVAGATDPLELGATPSSGHVRFFVGAPPR